MEFLKLKAQLLQRFPYGLPDANLEALFQLAQEDPEDFADQFVKTLANSGMDLGFDLAPSLAQTQFAPDAQSVLFDQGVIPERLNLLTYEPLSTPALPEATSTQLAQIGAQIAHAILNNSDLRARFVDWNERANSARLEHSDTSAADRALDDVYDELEDNVAEVESEAHAEVQQQSEAQFDYANTPTCASRPLSQYVLQLIEHGNLNTLMELHLASAGFLSHFMQDYGNITIQLAFPSGEIVSLTLPALFGYLEEMLFEPGAASAEDLESAEAAAPAASTGETFSPDPAAADKTAEASKAAETPPTTDTAPGKPEPEGYQSLDPDTVKLKPTGHNATELENTELPGYEATTYVEKLSENGGALPASTERFASASPRESAERMLSKFVRTHGAIPIIKPAHFASEFGETVSYWPQAFASDALPELGFFEAHFGYLSEFPVQLPNGEVEEMDLVELKATLRHYEGANTYFGLTPVVPGVVSMVFSPSFVPAPVASPGFVAPGMGLAPVF